MSVYWQMNLLLTASWLVFQVLSKSKVTFCEKKKIARVLVVISLLSPPLMFALPDFYFLDFKTPVTSDQGQVIDDEDIYHERVQKIFEVPLNAVGPIRHKHSTLPSVWLSLFFVGLFVSTGRRLITYGRLSRFLGSTMPLHELGRMRIVVSDLVSVPFSARSLSKAFVVLPTDLVPHRRDFMIALRHEIEHHRQGDTYWTLIVDWLTCFFYLSPGSYLWRETILKLQEFSCDEALISRMGISPQDYGRCLLRVAEMALDRRMMWGGTTCMIPPFKSKDHSFLRRRILMFSRYEHATAKTVAVAVFGIILSGSVFLAAYFAQAAVRADGLPNPGKPVFDQQIQSIAEDVLKKGLVEHGASRGFAIISDPVRGRVVATVSLNLKTSHRLSQDWALSLPLAPASALKPLIVAGGLQSGALKLDEMHDCEHGNYNLGGRTFVTDDKVSQLSTADTLITSNNVCMIKIGQKLGSIGIESALQAFGLGKGGSVRDFPGARTGQVPESESVSEDDYVGFVSLGTPGETKLSVTPLEMVQAYGAIANGGKLLKPIDGNSKQGPELIREVLSPDIAKAMRGTLRKVVEKGTGQRINGSSIALAGKTSTYMTGNQRITGFIGFAPADQPKLVVYVAMFDPKGKSKAGSNTAAPVFRDIVEKIISVYNP